MRNDSALENTTGAPGTVLFTISRNYALGLPIRTTERKTSVIRLRKSPVVPPNCWTDPA